MARAMPIPGLNPGVRFGNAAAAAIETRAREVFSHAEGVLDTADIDRVHDMRVATRRLRAAMEVFAGCFPEQEHRALLLEVKRLADALGQRRDPDVAIATLGRMAAQLTAADRTGIASLEESFREEQERGNASLAAALERVRDTGLHGRLAELARAARRERPIA